MNREICITLKGTPDHEETALLLEVIAGEIRNGRRSGDDPHFFWHFLPAGSQDQVIPAPPVSILSERDIP